MVPASRTPRARGIEISEAGERGEPIAGASLFPSPFEFLGVRFVRHPDTRPLPGSPLLRQPDATLAEDRADGLAMPGIAEIEAVDEQRERQALPGAGQQYTGLRQQLEPAVDEDVAEHPCRTLGTGWQSLGRRRRWKRRRRGRDVAGATKNAEHPRAEEHAPFRRQALDVCDEIVDGRTGRRHRGQTRGPHERRFLQRRHVAGLDQVIRSSQADANSGRSTRPSHSPATSIG